MMSEAEMFDELKQATEAYKIAESETSAARNRETSALNRLNKAQKAVSDMMFDLKKVAPRDSEWRRSDVRSLLAP